MSMDIVIYDSTGVPWLDDPLMLHSSREFELQADAQAMRF